MGCGPFWGVVRHTLPRLPMRRKKTMKSLWRVALVALLLSWQCVQAQQVLYLSTSETSGLPWDNAVYDAFRLDPATVALGGIQDGRGLLSSATAIGTALFDGKRVVIIGTTYGKINANQLPVLRDMILNRPDLTFLIFADGCCQETFNLNPIVNILSAGTGWGLGISTLIGAAIQSPLNTNSLYQASFAATLNPLVGTHYRLVTNVPADNALYLAQGVTTMPTTGTTTSAYGLFVPQARMNAGQGACTFLTADISPFAHDVPQGTPPQRQRAAAAFMAAALDPVGACRLATREPDLSPAITGPAALTIGTPATYQMTITNDGGSGSSNGTVTITLPAGLVVDANSLPAGCSATAPGIVCSDIGALAAHGGQMSGSFTVTPTAAVTGDIQVTVSGVSAPVEVNIANNTASLAVTALAPDLAPTIVLPDGGMIGGVPTTLTLNVANAATAGDSSGGTVTLDVPAGVSIGGGLPAGCTASGQTVTCTLAALPAGGLASFSIPVMPAQSGAADFTATVSGVPGETNTSNNIDTRSLFVTAPPPDLSTVITPPADGFAVGSATAVTLTVSNVAGSAGSTDGLVTLQIPAGMTIGGPLPAGCTAMSQAVTCTLPALAGGVSTSFSIPVTPTRVGPADFSASVTGVTGETQTDNNSYTLAATVRAPGQVQAVPTLGTWALLMLGALLPWLARRRRAL